jgi:SAM-dependent methyltransferase
MNRADWLLGRTNRNDPILEIGPSYRPIAPKSRGWRTHVVDHAPQGELRAKYLTMGVDVTAIEPVDSVWSGGKLHEAVPSDLAGSFVRIIASHVIEHLPDLIGFFDSAARLIAPGGTMALAVPDRRHCFDFFKPVTLTGDVIEAHTHGRTRHSRLTVWNQAAYSVEPADDAEWDRDVTRDLAFTSSLAAAARDYAAYSETPDQEYADFHAWHFTPAHFQLVMLELGQIGLVDWHVLEMESFVGEFLCTLRPGVVRLAEAPLKQLRLRWLYRGLADIGTQVEEALGERGASRSGSDWGAAWMLRRPPERDDD